MTTYPVAIRDRAAKAIKDMQNRLRVTEHRTSQASLRAKVAHANVNSLSAQVTTLQQQVENLFTKIGDPLQNGQGLTNAQSTFLAGLSVMNTPAGWPLATDPSGGSTWASNERVNYINPPINLDNDLVLRLIRNGYMTE